MKNWLVAPFLALTCSAASAAVVSMPFWDAAGTEYRTDNYAKQIRERFHPTLTPLLFVVVTHGTDEPEFKKQMAVLNQLDAEELQLLYVIGSATNVDKHSYWLAQEDAEALLEGGAHFRFLAIAPTGDVCFSSAVSVPATTIVASNKALQATFSRCARKRA